MGDPPQTPGVKLDIALWIEPCLQRVIVLVWDDAKISLQRLVCNGQIPWTHPVQAARPAEFAAPLLNLQSVVLKESGANDRLRTRSIREALH